MSSARVRVQSASSASSCLKSICRHASNCTCTLTTPRESCTGAACGRSSVLDPSPICCGSGSQTNILSSPG